MATNGMRGWGTAGAPRDFGGCVAVDALLEGASRVVDLGGTRVRATGRFLNLAPAEADARAMRRDWAAAARRLLGRGR